MGLSRVYVCGRSVMTCGFLQPFDSSGQLLGKTARTMLLVDE